MPTAELPRLLAIFLVVFDDLQGRKVAFQVPEGSVAGSSVPSSSVPPTSATRDISPIPPGSSLLSAAAHAHRNAAFLGSRQNRNEPLFDLSDVEQYILPRRPLVKHLVTICVEQCKVIGFPVWIDSQKSPRGRFMYNVCFAFERNAELTPYEPVVRKTGRVLRHMEETTQLLSNPNSELRLHSILEQIYEDLGSYSETSVLLDEANTLDLKLFPVNPNPATVRDWDIPIPLGSLQDMRDESWDTTMYALAAQIDGTSSVKRLANRADIDLPLARECVQHLLFYGCIMLHDLFQYTNSYALVGGHASIASVLHDDPYSRSIQAQCESYVSLTTPLIPFATLFGYYVKLQPSLSVEEWITRHKIDTSTIDIRRMISFGIIKGFLKRVQAYPVWLDHPSFQEAEEAQKAAAAAIHRLRGRQTGQRPLSLAVAPAQKNTSARAVRTTQERDTTPRPGAKLASAARAAHSDHIDRQGYPASLPALLDGEHSSDELCVRYRVSFRQLLDYLRMIGNLPQANPPTPFTASTPSFSLDQSKNNLGRVVLIHV